MVRFIVRDTYYGHVIHGGGYPETKVRSFDGDIGKLESFLRKEDLRQNIREEYVRKVIGIELL